MATASAAFRKTKAAVDLADPIIKTSVGIRQSVLQRLDIIAEEHRTSRSLLIQQAIDDLLEEEG